MDKDPFKEYIKESEPDKRDKGYAWHTAIGLQAVDGLKTSEYLVRTAVRNIESEITFEEANKLLKLYYEENLLAMRNTVWKKPIKFLCEQRHFCLSVLSALHLMSNFPFTGS